MTMKLKISVGCDIISFKETCFGLPLVIRESKFLWDGCIQLKLTWNMELDKIRDYNE